MWTAKLCIWKKKASWWCFGNRITKINPRLVVYLVTKLSFMPIFSFLPEICKTDWVKGFFEILIFSSITSFQVIFSELCFWISALLKGQFFVYLFFFIECDKRAFLARPYSMEDLSRSFYTEHRIWYIIKLLFEGDHETSPAKIFIWLQRFQ